MEVKFVSTDEWIHKNALQSKPSISKQIQVARWGQWTVKRNTRQLAWWARNFLCTFIYDEERDWHLLMIYAALQLFWSFLLISRVFKQNFLNSQIYVESRFLPWRLLTLVSRTSWRKIIFNLYTLRSRRFFREWI